MLWFFLEALVALVIAVAIVGWTMGFGRRKPRDQELPRGGNELPRGGNELPKSEADRDRNGSR